MAVVEIGGSLFIDVLNFNCWLSQDKDEVSNFLNLRTRKQILATSRIKPSKLDAWLKVRWTNGLHEAVIAKGPRKLYIDIHKLNRWLMEQNKNAGFGQLHIEELAG
ncbi:MAG: hypothetical protein COB49_12465 [Alphaproteobacteria bacterium]|nr:MAG: hypothetical protein COB49_12465 [Alphaproteobacteria bacterium]